MRKYFNARMLVEIISALFVLLFSYASISKLIDFQKFEVELGKSPLLNSFSETVAYGIPTLEILLVLLLVFNRTQLAALYFSFSLMLMFTSYIVAILNFSDYIPCSCGGVLQNMTWNQHFWFNLAFVGLSTVSILIYPSQTNDLLAIRGHAQTRK